METGSRLVALLLNVLDLDLPWRRLQRCSVGVLMTIALLFPGAFRTGLLRFSEARACSIEQTLSHELKLSRGSFRVIAVNGWCELHFDSLKDP
jgi:hypothetical protein